MSSICLVCWVQNVIFGKSNWDSKALRARISQEASRKLIFCSWSFEFETRIEFYAVWKPPYAVYELWGWHGQLQNVFACFKFSIVEMSLSSMFFSINVLLNIQITTIEQNLAFLFEEEAFSLNNISDDGP